MIDAGLTERLRQANAEIATLKNQVQFLETAQATLIERAEAAEKKLTPEWARENCPAGHE